MNSRQAEFARLVARGESKAQAYRMVYKNTKNNQRAAELGGIIHRSPAVRAEIARIRGLAVNRALLSVNDQLGILADNARVKGKSPAHINAKTRAVDVYARIAGTMAPVRQEVTGAGGGPIPMQATVLTAHLTPREKARLLREQLTASRTAPTPAKAAS